MLRWITSRVKHGAGYNLNFTEGLKIVNYGGQPVIPEAEPVT